MLARLFPFGRGLCHSYWAPNAWALYAASDRVAAAVVPRLTQKPLPSPVAGLTSGLVGGVGFAVLPSVGPAAAAAVTVAAQVPVLVALWRRPQGAGELARAVVLSLLSSFVWGYHVHEKAILMVLVPMAINAARSRADASTFLFMAAVGHHSLFPLLHQPREWPLKVAIAFVYFLGIRLLLSLACPATTTSNKPRADTDPQPTVAASSTPSHSSSSRASRLGGRGGSSISREPTEIQPAHLSVRNDSSGSSSNSGSNMLGASASLDARDKAEEVRWQLNVPSIEAAFLRGLIPLELYCTFAHPVLFGSSNGITEGGKAARLPFLPLLLTSVYCGIGILWAWAKLEAAVVADIIDMPRKVKVS